jgi:hypothetical protein
MQCFNSQVLKWGLTSVIRLSNVSAKRRKSITSYSILMSIKIYKRLYFCIESKCLLSYHTLVIYLHAAPKIWVPRDSLCQGFRCSGFRKTLSIRLVLPGTKIMLHAETCWGLEKDDKWETYVWWGPGSCSDGWIKDQTLTFQSLINLFLHYFPSL